jgi:hypothetical protein
MANKIFLQTILKFRDQIKEGSAKFADVIEDYVRTSGKTPTEEERAILIKEIEDNAPSNVVNFEGVDPRETIMPTGGVKFGKIDYDMLRKQYPGVEIRGDETFDELLEKFKSSKQGISSLFPKGKGAAFEKIDDRDDVAEFVKKMRGAGIKNEDIRGVFKETGTDIEGGKRAATTLARAADMGADTKIKQQLLSELDEMKLDSSPRFFQEEYMGFDDFKSAIDAKKIEVNNAIVDDLEAMGVPEERISDIMGVARRQRDSYIYTSGEDFVDIIKGELEIQDIDYDVEFYKNYFRELESLMRKPKPRFMFGGVV